MSSDNNIVHRCKKHGTQWEYNEQLGICLWNNPRDKTSDKTSFPTPCNKSKSRKPRDLSVSEILFNDRRY